MRTADPCFRSNPLVLAVILIAALLMGGPFTADVLTRASRHDVGAPPTELNAERLTLKTQEGETVAAWLVRGRRGAGAVLLLHGLRGDRRKMVGRALFLKKLGYTVLCVDLPAHGESSGSRITFGQREARGVDAALDYLASSLQLEHIGVIGVSLGGAALLLAREKHFVSAVVLESVYATFYDAVANRMHRYAGPMTLPLATLTLDQLPPRAGVSARELRPIDAIAQLDAPVLIVSGGEDRYTTPEDTAQLFAAAREPKEFWLVQGAAHVDLHGFAAGEYEERIGMFFAKYLDHETRGRVPLERAHARAH